MAQVLERVVHDPYGLARHHYAEDVTGDGGVDSTRDVTAINGVAGGGNNDIGESSYRAEMDLDRDGDVDYDDASIVSAVGTVAALPLGWVSDITVGGDSPMGYCGYLFNRPAQLYAVRFRVYDPSLGRWLTRDPARYMDSMGLYGYVGGSPGNYTDPMGLARFSRDPAEDRRLKGDLPGFSDVYGSQHEYAADLYGDLLIAEIWTVTAWKIVGVFAMAILTPGTPDEWGMILGSFGLGKWTTPVLIGADWRIVKATAIRLGYKYYGGGFARLVVKLLGATDKNKKDKIYLRFNKLWARWIRLTGRPVRDLGPILGRDSPFYEWERRIFRGYRNYKPLFTSGITSTAGMKAGSVGSATTVVGAGACE